MYLLCYYLLNLLLKVIIVIQYWFMWFHSFLQKLNHYPNKCLFLKSFVFYIHINKQTNKQTYFLYLIEYGRFFFFLLVLNDFRTFFYKLMLIKFVMVVLFIHILHFSLKLYFAVLKFCKFGVQILVSTYICT